jgi:hypothetical protein
VNVQALHGVILSGWYFGALARGFAFGSGRALSAAATILSEKAEQRVHFVELSSVDHRPAITAHGDKPGHPEPIEMKGQGVGSEVERCSNSSRWHALGSGLHKQPKYVEPIILGECG